MFFTLQENEEIKTTTWMIILSIIPSDLVRTGALLLGGIIVISHIVHTIRPRGLMEKLQIQLLFTEEKLKAAIDTGIMAQADANSITQIERKLGKWVLMHVQYKILLTVMWFIKNSIQCFWASREDTFDVWGSTGAPGSLAGQSFEIYECLQDVKALERELEVCWFDLFFFACRII